MVKTMANRYAGPCDVCKGWIPARMGVVTRYNGRPWRLTHIPATWHGSPISGGWVNGCPPRRFKASTRKVARNAVRVVRIKGRPFPRDAMSLSGILATLRTPVGGVEITREYELARVCRYCKARPADEPGYCHHEQCLAGREVTAARDINALKVIRRAA